MPAISNYILHGSRGIPNWPARPSPISRNARPCTTDYTGLTNCRLAIFFGGLGEKGLKSTRMIELGTPTKTSHRAANRWFLCQARRFCWSSRFSVWRASTLKRELQRWLRLGRAVQSPLYSRTPHGEHFAGPSIAARLPDEPVATGDFGRRFLAAAGVSSVLSDGRSESGRHGFHTFSLRLADALHSAVHRLVSAADRVARRIASSRGDRLFVVADPVEQHRARVDEGEQGRTDSARAVAKPGRRPVEELDGHDVSRRQILRRRAAALYRPTALRAAAIVRLLAAAFRIGNGIGRLSARACRGYAQPKSPAIARSNRSTIARSCGCLSFRQ